MKIQITCAAVLLALCLPMIDTAHAEGPSTTKKLKTEYLYVTVAGVKTAGVAAAIQAQVQRIDGVRSFAWTTALKEAKIVRIVGKASLAELVAACKTSGASVSLLPVVQHRLTFAKVLHCNGCVLKVKRALKASKGVKEYRVAEDRKSVVVVYDNKRISVDQLKQAIAKTGYAIKTVS